MKAFKVLLLAYVLLFFVCPYVPAAEPLLAIGGGVGFLELGGLKELLSVASAPRLIWQLVIEAPAEQKLSARFALALGSFHSISLTQLDTLLLVKLGGKVYAGAGSGLMRFIGPGVNMLHFGSYGLIGLKSPAFEGATFFLDLKLIFLFPNIGAILGKGAVPLQLSFGMTFKL